MLTLGFLLFQSQCVLGQTDQPQSSLQAANAAVNQAFNAVSAAEGAGANVTNLMNQLNNAASLLAQAENAYRTGDNSTVFKDASAVVPITEQVTAEAQTAKETALASRKNAFWSTITITIVSAVVFVAALFLVWRLLKRVYFKGLMEAKPEVANQ